MKIKNTLIITLFLLCILMIGAVNASSDTSTTISSDVSDDTIVSSDVSDNTPVSTDKSDDTITSTKDNTGKKKTSTIDTTTEIKKANNNEKPISDGYNPKSYIELNKTVNNATAGPTIELNSNFVYKDSTDKPLMSGININRTMTIDGHYNTIDGDNKAGIFNIISGANVTIKNLKFVNAVTAITVAEGCTLKLINCTFNQNTAPTNGGAIYNNGNITTNNTQFNKNKAQNGGSAIYNNGVLTITENTQFNQNTAFMGTIYNNGKINIIDAQFNNNTATFGGAIYSTNESTIYNTQFNNNTATDSGGAIYTTLESNTFINRSIFNNNTGVDGGAILNYGKLKIIDAQFNNNTAKGKFSDGGAIYTDNELTIEKSQFNNNTADNGGAIYNHDYDHDAKLTIIDSTFLTNNATENGGAIYTWKYIDVTDSKFIRNNDTNENAIYIVNGTKSKIQENYFLDNNITCENGDELDLSTNTINIRLKTKFIIQNITNTTTDKGINLNITEINKFNGQITIKIGNKEYNITLTDGSYISDSIIIPTPGTYNVTINFPGTLGLFPTSPDYREAYAISNNFTIKYPTKFIIQTITNNTIDKPITLNITEINNFNGTIPIKIGENEYNITFTNGNCINNTIQIKTVGAYNVTINFPGNENYTEANTTSNQFLVKYPTKFTITPIVDTTSSNPITITVSELNGFTGSIPVNIGTQSYTVTLKNGQGTSDPIKLAPGKYSATINFPGNDEYAATQATSNIFIISDSALTYNNIKIDINNKNIITPILRSSEIDVVCYVKDNDRNYLDGIITITFYTAQYNHLTLKTEYIPKSYTWEFNAEEKISGFWVLNNNKIVLRKTISSEDEKKGLNIVSSKNNKYLYNKFFKGEDGGNSILYMISNTKFQINKAPVSISENGTTIDLTKPYYKVTKMKVSYLKNGEKDRVSLTKSVKFTHDIVKAKKTKVTLSLKKVKIKKSAKKLTLKATLKINKKYAKGKTVIFRFNGKKYKAKTNKKGVAKVTIKKSVLKKLKVGKKVKYSARYIKVIKKRTAKVKK